jgi:hypothetical protein
MCCMGGIRLPILLSKSVVRGFSGSIQTLPFSSYTNTWEPFRTVGSKMEWDYSNRMMMEHFNSNSPLMEPSSRVNTEWSTSLKWFLMTRRTSFGMLRPRSRIKNKSVHKRITFTKKTAEQHPCNNPIPD